MIFQSTRFVNDFYRKFFRFPMATASISHVLLRQWQCRLHDLYIANCVPILCTRKFIFATTKSALNSTLCEVIHRPYFQNAIAQNRQIEVFYPHPKPRSSHLLRCGLGFSVLFLPNLPLLNHHLYLFIAFLFSSIDSIGDFCPQSTAFSPF